MSTSSYKPQKGRGLSWPLDTDAPSVADQAETLARWRRRLTFDRMRLQRARS